MRHALTRSCCRSLANISRQCDSRPFGNPVAKVCSSGSLGSGARFLEVTTSLQGFRDTR